MIYTFYSYKGGVGRSMALANVAKYFSMHGLRVVLVDWDLEAPGLESFFCDSEEELTRVRSQLGLVDMLASYKRQFPTLGLQEAGAEKLSGRLDAELLPLSSILCPLDRKGDGLLWLLSAGWRAGEQFAAYASVVQSFDWTDFYERFAGEAYFEWLRRQLLNPEIADVALIDSRTGVTEMGGVCTRQLADVVVAFSVPNFQNLAGVTAMAASFKRTEVLQYRGRDLDVILVPTRIDANEIDRRNRFEAQFEAATASFTPLSFRNYSRRFWDLKLPYVSKYAYEEALAIGSPDSAEELNSAYQSLAAHLALVAPPENFRLREVWDRFWRLAGTPPTAADVPSVFRAPRPNSYFTGREPLLSELHSRLTNDRLAVLQGVVGVGKSQVAAEYIQRHRNDYDIVWWVVANDQSSIDKGLVQLAESLGLSHRVEQASDARDAVTQWMTRNQRWLLVLDNANVPIGYGNIPPQVSGHVLVTSTDPGWSSLAPMIAIPVLTRAESVDFLFRRTGESDEDAAPALAEALGDLPLALELAAAYVATTGRSISACLDLLRTNEEGLLQDSVPGAAAVRETLQVALGALSRDDANAAELLGTAAFFAPQEVPLRLLLGPSPPTIESDAALLAIRRHGLAEVRDDALRVHRLVQTLARQNGSPVVRAGYADRAVALANNALERARSERAHSGTLRVLIEHALAAADHARQLELPPSGIYALLSNAGEALGSQSDYARARMTLERALSAAQDESAPPHEIVDIRRKLGRVLREAGEIWEARMVLEEPVPGQPGPDPATQLELGRVLQDLGAVDLALLCLRSAASRQDPGEHALYAEILLALGQLLRKTGAFSEASSVLEQALPMTRIGDAGPNYGELIIELGELRLAAGDAAGAVSAASQAIDAVNRIPPAKRDRRDHQALIGAAHLLAAAGDQERARATLELALASMRETQGPESSDFAGATVELGLVLRQLGDISGSRHALEEALKLDERIYGSDHPTVARDLTLLSSLIDDPVAARAMLERAVWISSSSSGHDSPQTQAYSKMLEALVAKTRTPGELSPPRVEVRASPHPDVK